MRRHLVWGQFGESDTYSPTNGGNEHATRLNLLSGNGGIAFGVDRLLRDIRGLGLCPSEIGLDLLVVAAHVHAADTRISRYSESQDSWTREIKLVVPVSNPDRWRQARDVLCSMTAFLTGDRWKFEFRARPSDFAEMVQAPPPRLEEVDFDSLALFSGGLDSLIGAIDRLESGDSMLLVSHAGDGASSDAQYRLFSSLQERYAGRILNRVRLAMRFPANLVVGSKNEDTTRGRSFLFFSLGLFAGSAFGRPFKLYVPENGLIAINVPLDKLRLGALSTRTTHPYYMAMWNVLSETLGLSGVVVNPYQYSTKGEMVAGCANVGVLRELLPVSMSCSAPGKLRYQHIGNQHCGYCLPCLIRRAAIDAGLGRGADTTVYSVADLSSRVIDSKRSEGKQVRSFQLAIDRIRRRPSLAKLLVQKPGPLSGETQASRDELAQVYRRGLEEVGNFLAGVRTRPLT